MKKLLSLFISVLLLVSLTGCLSNNYENGELYIFLPGEYLSDEVVEQFEYEYKIKVSVTTFDSNESMYTKLLGGTVYDLLIPSDYMIERLINEKMIQKLDKSKLPNMSALDPQVLDMAFDPGNQYSVPYFWGNAGICYDTTQIDSEDVESEGWAVLQNTKYKGMIYMYDSIRDAFMVAEKALGYSMNTDDPDELNAAYEWLLQISKTMEPAFVTDEIIDGLTYGEKAMGMVYSGDAALILSENEDMAFWAPEEGTNYFVDAMVIHKDAKNAENAYKFINYIIEYDAAFENATFVGYTSSNAEVVKDITMEGGDFEDNDAYVPREMNENDEVFHSNEELLKIISELWVKVKNTK
ncbi:MAG: ABC transporter substrate-binding protein [Erysipelotrichaceae bacterium]|nr:ABC transporter substrate-binding protein [Erysipelotrichaceae bacterium]